MNGSTQSSGSAQCLCINTAAAAAFSRWSGPYLRRVIESVKSTHPSTPLTLYANGSGGLLERLGATGADVVGLDWTVDMADARRRLGSKSVQVRAPLGGVARPLLIDANVCLSAALMHLMQSAGGR